MPKKYRIHLSNDERTELETIVKDGKAATSKRLRVQVLLASDENQANGALKDTDIAHAVGVSVASVERACCALAENGLQVAVHGWPPHWKQPRSKINGWAEAHLMAASCSKSPKARHGGLESL